jgi:putative sterol carrier protein
MTATTVGPTAGFEDFFADLAQRGYEPLLARVTATVRFDVTDGDRTEHRLLEVEHGKVHVLVGDGPADCVLTGERAVFDAIVTGRTTVMAALLRGTLTVDGDPELVVLTQRLFRGPPDGSAGSPGASGSGRSS